MVSFSTKVKRTFLPKKRTSLTVKSDLIAPSKLGNPSAAENASLSGVSWADDTDQDQDLDEKDGNIDKFKIKDDYNSGYISPVDRMVVKVVHWSGSASAFFLSATILVLWAIVGIVYKAPDTWQIVMQDGQSIQCYIWDTLLMRQQLDDNNEFLRLYGRLKSRYVTHKRLLQFMQSGKGKVRSKDIMTEVTMEGDSDVEEHNKLESQIKLTGEGWFDRMCSFISHCIGSLPMVIIYWIGVFVWIACGSLNLRTSNTAPFSASNPEYAKWSDEWQMYINTAVAVVLLTTSVILENVRARNNKFVQEQIGHIGAVDCQVESIGRYTTGDMDDNAIIEVPGCERKHFRKMISWYAEVIGTGVGLMLSAGVFVTWISIGHTLKWNSDWWLIIGTYTGLVGYVDGFTLREVYYSITLYEEDKFMELLADSQELLELAGIDYQLRELHEKKNIGHRISAFVSKATSSQYAVVASICTVIGLICIATGLGWSVTGQLICNSPTMIIEAFCMLILIQSHSWADYKRRFVVKQLAVSRNLLLEHVKNIEDA
ncbi:hypothetical protein FOA43_003100 [Brettanomyces nanus]|uniref:Uncharacterized protein n=1 Tax=Eeniella nana TaxID=13502 RepID=A0A875RQ14_EENNA|nr:uncharacterized protein FOA43_003100 [Brettanomyces nanus]QPG75740.1 hypothetical protein FOA43_003100 [Brettanomyces nanus]